MNRIERFLVGGVLTCTLLPAGCVGGCNLWGAVHPHTSWGAVSKLRRGMTKEEVIQVAGEPYDRRARKGGRETWYYAEGWGGWIDLTMAEFDTEGLFVGTWIH